MHLLDQKKWYETNEKELDHNTYHLENNNMIWNLMLFQQKFESLEEIK